MSGSAALAVPLLEMVQVLHQRGHQRLRITPAIAPSGLYWRLVVSAPDCDEAARYTTGDGTAYYGWTDAEGLHPEQLADRFTSAFPRLVEAGTGPDPPYAAWLSHVVDLARSGWLPYFHADWETPETGSVPLVGLEPGREDPPVLAEPPGGR